MTSFYIIKNVNEPKLHFFSKNDIPFSSSFFYFLNRDLQYLKKNYKNVNEIQKVLIVIFYWIKYIPSLKKYQRRINIFYIMN